MNTSANSSPLPDEVIQVIKNGSKIEAIKLLREKTGLGLKESKDLVEAYEDNRPVGSQPLRRSDSHHSGLILLVVLGLVAYAIYRFISG